MIRALFVFFAVVIGVSFAGGARANETTLPTPMIVGGGTPFGYYFGLAGSICAAVNRTTDTGIRCLTVSNDGSAQNIADVDSGKIDFAIVQSDWLYHAANGTSRYRSTGANDELRSVVAVPSEALTILARRSIGAKILTHLGGRRIGYG
ncbi:MAG: TAXI family TRAP transporter solute-binding subunit, partial [Rickettsiales bacterium]